MTTAAETIEQTAAELGLSMTAEFIPWSKSRNAKEKQPSLNWRVTIRKATHSPASDIRTIATTDGPAKHIDILTTDYSAGCGHCPAYKANGMGMPTSIMRTEAIKWECENGRAAHAIDHAGTSLGFDIRDTRKPILPKLADVLHSLASDSDALDYTGFEDWAGNYGYDLDSRSAEATYRACLDIAIKLRAAIGDAGLAKLREACEGY